MLRAWAGAGHACMLRVIRKNMSMTIVEILFVSACAVVVSTAIGVWICVGGVGGCCNWACCVLLLH